MKTLFNQAVIGPDAKTLRAIRGEAINLAMWQNPLSETTRQYLSELSVKDVVRHYKCKNGYYYSLGNLRTGPGVRPSQLVEENSSRGGVLRFFPDGAGKDALIGDFLKLKHAFTAATGLPPRGLNLLAFKPSSMGFWHTDAHNYQSSYRGIITLTGDAGTLWRPDDSLPRNKKRTDCYWGDVKPAHEKFIQHMPVGAFSIFKCNCLPNPLVHATPPKPMAQGYRLACLMGA